MNKNIRIWFAGETPHRPSIKHTMRNFAPVSQTPFADLMLRPEKLAAALKIARRENEAFEASRKFGRTMVGSDAANASVPNKQNQNTKDTL